jgi:hypothetical protein
MVKKGRKPTTPSPLSDPQVWQWCKHEECLEQAKKLKGFGSGGDEEQKLMRKASHLCVVYGEDYCWKHLSGKKRTKYNRKLEDWIHEGTIDGANLQGIEFSGGAFKYASFHETNLKEATLQAILIEEADFIDTNLEGAKLYNIVLQGADFFGVNLKEAYLSDVNLAQAKMTYCNLQATYLNDIVLREVNFFGSELIGAFLDGAFLNDARNLTWAQIYHIGEEKNRSWESARDGYRLLKNYFHQQGQYEDEAKAYYREKLMAQKQAWKETKIWKWFWLFVLNTLAGFGEKLWKTVVSAFITIFFFAGIYCWGTNAGWGKLVHGTAGHIKDFWHCLYFSVVTFATLGFGDIAPAFSSKAAIAAVFEVILGYVFLGMLITIIARKFGR